MMKAVRVHDYGEAEQMRLDEVPVPVPSAGEVLVKLAYAGVNFIDVYVRNGNYKRSETYAQTPPLTLGMEGAGFVEAVGEGVEDFIPGDPVAYCIELGSYAEYAVVPAWKLVHVLDGVSLDIAAALQLQGSTAHYLSHSLFPLQPGDSCLIHAGAGGLGQLLIQLAKRLEATVFTTVGSAEKAEITAALGADHTILYRDDDFAEAVLDLTAGEGVDVVYDSVGKDTIQGSLKCVRRCGVISNNGNASGPIGPLDPLDLAEAGSVFFTRPHLADYIASAEERQGRAYDLFGWYAAGELKVSIDRTLPLAEARQAHEMIEARQTKGKMLLAV